MVRSIQHIATATVALLWSMNAVTAEHLSDFRRIPTDFGDSKPKGVVLPTICIGDFLVPKTMYTFETIKGDDANVTILSNPEYLVEPGYDSDEGLIYFKFNLSASELAEDAGVVVQFPADQLETINACCSQSVQIKDGFTNFQNLTVSTSAIVNASFPAQESNLTVDVSEGGVVNVKVVDGENIDISATEGTANILGNITKISCTDESSCKVTGSITAPGESEIDEGATIETPICEGLGLGKGAVCESIEPKVRVVVSRPLVISGVKETCVNGDGLFGAFGPNEPPTEAPTISPAPTLTEAPIEPPTASPTKKPTNEPTQAPTNAPTVEEPVLENWMIIAIACGGTVLLVALVILLYYLYMKKKKAPPTSY